MTPPKMFPVHPAAGEKRSGPDSRRAAELDRRQGRAYARIAPRPMLEVITGLSHGSVHLRAHGERRVSLAELDRLARSVDPKVNPFHMVAEAVAVIQAARSSVAAADLIASIAKRSLDEQHADGREDIPQLELHEAIDMVRAQGIAGLSYMQKQQVRKAITAYLEASVRHLAASMALIGDLEVLSQQLDTRH